MLSFLDLHTYQDKMIDRIKNPISTDTVNICGWAGMGTGKTVVALTVAEDMLRAREVKKVLVVSTKKAAEHTWQHEHSEWDHLEHQGEYTTLLFGTPTQRADKLGKQGIHIINQENLPWLVAGYGIKEWPYDMVIIDDCKGFKKASAATFTATRHIMPKVRKFLILNGTPMPNGYVQLWPQIFIVDKGKRLGLSAGDYKRRFFMQADNGYKFIPRDSDCVNQIDALVSDIAFSVDIEDYIDVPQALNPPPVKIHLPEKLRKQYEELEEEFFLALEGGEEIEALTQANLGNKLAQFCNGAVYTNPEVRDEYTVIHDLKLDALSDVIEEMAGENLIVAYNFKSDWERIKKRFPFAVHVNDRDSVVKEWNDGKIRLLACHPGSAGHGLNLQHGGRTICWFGSEWSLELNQQMDERVGAVRQAQSGLNRQPRYIRLAVENSVEQSIAQAIIDKADTQELLKAKVKLDRSLKLI